MIRTQSVFTALAISVLVTCSVIVVLRPAGRMTVSSIVNSEQHLLASQLCGATRQTPAQRCSEDHEYAKGGGKEGGESKREQENKEEGGRLPGRREEEGGIEEQVVNEREGDKESREEEERVVSRIETCLLSTNVSTYLEEQGYLLVAYDNGRNMIRTLRKIIPRTFSTDYLSPCWKADFNGSVQLQDQTVKWVVDGREIVTPFSSLVTRAAIEFTSRHKKTVSSPLICLPKIFNLGFSKCGSGYLYCVMGRRFSGGPGVQAPKEPRWWTHHQIASMFHSSKPALEYIPPYLFNFLATSIELASGRSKYQQPLTIDGSPNMILNWPQWYKKDEHTLTNYCLVPAILSEVLPDSKYVVIMRNPVDRLYSAFWFSCHSDRNATLFLQNLSHPGPDIFHERIKSKVKHFVECIKTYPVAVCMSDIRNSYHSQSDSLSTFNCGKTVLERSFYYFHIQRWLSVIPRKNFVFLTMEELSADIDLVEEKILTLLGSTLPHHLTLRNEDLSVCNKRKHFQSSYRDNPRLHMRADTRKMLTDLYRPYNQMLANLLGEEKFLWES